MNATTTTINENIATAIKNNPEGFSLKPNGELAKHTEGFYVSITNNSGFKQKSLINKVIRLKTENFKASNLLYGGWTENKKLYLDLSLWVKDLNTALNLGKNFNQTAIYDIENNESIYI